jgi:hypothetical protein
MSNPGLRMVEERAINHVFDMNGGYVLDFSNRTFALFFRDLNIDIDQEIPEGSKATRLREFLSSRPPSQVAATLRVLLEYRGPREPDATCPEFARVKGLVARLEGELATLSVETPGLDVLSHEYLQELQAKMENRLKSNDLDGTITLSRTLVEAVLGQLELRLVSQPADYKGDLAKQYRAVTKLLRVDDERADLDDHLKQVVRGLVQVVAGLAPIRNKMSDGHARERAPLPHHARLTANAAKTIATFLVESYLIQRECGKLPAAPVPAQKEAATP